MKLRKGIFGLVLFIVAIASNSCGMINRIPISSITPSPAITAQASMKSNTPTLKSTPSETSTSTPEITDTATMPSVPTLSVVEAQTRLLSLLSNNDNCRLPCLWGIVPGTSSSEDAIRRLFPLSSISQETFLRSDSGTIYPRINEGNLIIIINISYRVEDDSITKLQLIASVRNQEGNYISNSESYGKKLAYYSLFHILDEYGQPSSVLLRTNGGLSPNGELGAFYFILLYPDQGIIVNYFTEMRISDANALGCPSNAQIIMDLYPSDDIESFNEKLTRYWGEKLPWYKPLEDVTSMTIDKFYQTFRYPTTQCVVTPLKFWPKTFPR